MRQTLSVTEWQRIANPELPGVDERMIAPASGYEIEDGVLVEVSPPVEPGAARHVAFARLLTAHRHASYLVGLRMLTRASYVDDFAPDACVYPAERDPQTGDRKLESLAFLIANPDSLGHAGIRAAKLVARGVRRVFAIVRAQDRAFEWSTVVGSWSLLDARSEIADEVLAVPLPVTALIDPAQTDASIARVLETRGHQPSRATREERRREAQAEADATRAAVAVVRALEGRGLCPTHDERMRILRERVDGQLARWARLAAICGSSLELFV